MLSSSFIKGVKNGYPLGIKVIEKKTINVDFNDEFISNIVDRIDWPVLVSALKEVD